MESAVKRRVVILSAAAIILIVFSPAFVPVFWHMIHGNAVECSGKRVPVPRLWYASIHNRSVYFTKLSMTVFGSIPVSSFLGPIPGRTPTPRAQEETYAALERLYLKMQRSNEFTGASLSRLGSGTDEMACLKAYSAGNSQWVTIDCVLFQGTWNAHFVGLDGESENFFRTISGITAAGGTR